MCIRDSSITAGAGNLKGVHFNQSSTTTAVSSTSFTNAHTFTYTAAATNPKVLVMLHGKAIDGYATNKYGQIIWELLINNDSFLTDSYGTKNSITTSTHSMPSSGGTSFYFWPHQILTRSRCKNATYNSGDTISVVLRIRNSGTGQFQYQPSGSDGTQAASLGTVYWFADNITVLELA